MPANGGTKADSMTPEACPQYQTISSAWGQTVQNSQGSHHLRLHGGPAVMAHPQDCYKPSCCLNSAWMMSLSQYMLEAPRHM